MEEMDDDVCFVESNTYQSTESDVVPEWLKPSVEVHLNMNGKKKCLLPNRQLHLKLKVY